MVDANIGYCLMLTHRLSNLVDAFVSRHKIKPLKVKNLDRPLVVGSSIDQETSPQLYQAGVQLK